MSETATSNPSNIFESMAGTVRNHPKVFLGLVIFMLVLIVWMILADNYFPSLIFWKRDGKKASAFRSGAKKRVRFDDSADFPRKSLEEGEKYSADIDELSDQLDEAFD